MLLKNFGVFIESYIFRHYIYIYCIFTPVEAAYKWLGITPVTLSAISMYSVMLQQLW